MSFELSRVPETEKPISAENAPKLLLHACCAPCAASVIEKLAGLYEITIFFYNPNIHPRAEYYKRAGEFDKLLANAMHPIKPDLIVEDYDSLDFDNVAASFIHEKEGGIRCQLCYNLRLEKTARHAIEGGFRYFGTTLTISPHKNAKSINEIGSRIESESQGQLIYLCEDFKKHDGYKRSVEISKQYGLYRQNYCGCASSLTQ